MGTMGTITCLVLICFSLFEQRTKGHANPENPALRQHTGDTIKFDWETTSRTDEYLVQGRTYYSQSRGWYRFDAYNGKGVNQLFVLPYDGLAIYYFPKIADYGNRVNQCYKMVIHPNGRRLPSPIPSVGQGYWPDGRAMIRGELLFKWKYVTYQNFTSELQNQEMSELFFPPSTSNPVRLEYKKWLTHQFPLKDRLVAHEVTDYYDFSFVEEDVWNFPNNCDYVMPGDARGAAIIAHAHVVHVPEELECMLQPNCSRQNTRYSTGGVKYSFEPRAYADDLESADPQNSDQEDLPLSWDWRDYGAVTSVKNQRDCGSCWAFGAVAALESAYFLKHNLSVVFSEQFLIDCGWALQNEGCIQGSHESAFEWIKETGGIPLSEDYSPYKNMNGYCEYKSDIKLQARIEDYRIIPSTTYNLKYSLVHDGPIVVFIDAHPMFTYASGIITNCTAELKDHFVLLVGYGETRDHEPYWIVKNSWGNSWGMDGYALISARPDENCLGILDIPLFPILQ